ncbi:sensor domain-containing diguanylate cyclase [Cronobacter malonaticus]|uniref:diguanylate cyclase n=1 Tax=Cronobacter malonaticus TaxID=413503 RepID=A0A423XTI3_9ENTR|nr:sensor domain-containing diguanylate cyclase [Cronobacter malonaticus]EGT4279645.1 sensor domain-containing diguanylate cyclase [Cronobacter malonaticus]EGT4286742.1 sensor domain-containing diguanylate cyclase [Cronobacter malonaticus]EGT4298123.1 sensor domain-containing diguanylate cyclase [Cronobacter malonaticus]EGT4312713.1 sensor domain-containing diguanylate cyclase [Cronobacter malonaticus]EGT4333330.1 sensor domain-containing diguanylate cyclase [Cronobacter malonaticus]
MKTPDIPVNEQARLQSLHDSGLLDAAPTERFDRLTRLAKRLFNAPVALISLVDQEQLLFASCDGAEPVPIPRRVSFCGHTILSNTPLVISDALSDERFRDNPLVNGPPHIRFYAGCPVRLPDGATAGSLCIIDTEPRQFSDTDAQVLRDLAAIVEDEFMVLSVATSDELTGLLNRRGFTSLAGYAFSTHKRRSEPMSLGFIDLDDFKEINDTWGHAAGDEALNAMAMVMKNAFRDSDLLGRLGGDEFVVLFNDTDEKGAWIALQYLVEQTDAFNRDSGKPWRLGFSWGVVQFDDNKHQDLAGLLKAADNEMYQMKTTHKRAAG